MPDGDAIADLLDLPHARANLYRTYADRAVVELIAAEFVSFVVEREQSIVGFVRLAPSDGWLAEVQLLAVREPGLGTGWFALRETVRYAFEVLRVHRISLDVASTNARARRLYEGLGFVLEGTLRDGFRDAGGVYVDLCMYGLLARDDRAARESLRFG